MMSRKLSRTRKKDLRLAELIAIALGGMVGGGIFAILGVSVEQIGNATPFAILIGGILAFFAAYSYVKLTFPKATFDLIPIIITKSNGNT